jgi:hypothetical protein
VELALSGEVKLPPWTSEPPLFHLPLEVFAESYIAKSQLESPVTRGYPCPLPPMPAVVGLPLVPSPQSWLSANRLIVRVGMLPPAPLLPLPATCPRISVSVRNAAGDIELDERSLPVQTSVGAGKHSRALATGVVGVGVCGSSEDDRVLGRRNVHDRRGRWSGDEHEGDKTQEGDW